MDQDDLMQRYERVINPGLGRVFRFMGLTGVEATGHGAVLVDEAGVEYLDLAGGYGVFLLGYQHPRILAAARRQLDKMALSSRVLLNRPMVELAEALSRWTPGDLTYSFFCNSGTEAVEAALKFARAATGRSVFVSTRGAFHGKTMGSLSVSGRELYQMPFKPLVPDVVRVEYGRVDAVEAVMSSDVAAVIVEPIQGEGGVVVPPDDYLAGLRAACDRAGALLIVDEVQTGMGRTGKLFAIEHAGVTPDLLCLAKGLGGGVMPVGAVVGRPEAWRFLEEYPLIHTSTFGGNPLAMATGLEALRVTVEERLPERALTLGAILKEGLTRLWARYPSLLSDVRGMGLMLGIEVKNPGIAAALMSELFSRRILAVYTLNNERVIRMIPPLVITEAEIGQALEGLDGAMAAVSQYADELE